MTNQRFTLDDLRRILIASAGAPEGPDVGQDTADMTFEELGYDSLALLETGSHIERELGISLDDSDVLEAHTPRELIAVINAHLTATSGASA